LEVCSRRSLTRFASLMISWHSEALWRLLGCTVHEPLLPPCGRGRLLRSFRPLVAVAMTGAAVYGLSWPRFFFFFVVLGDGTRATHLGNSGLWCRVPCPALSNSGTFVGQSKERGDSLHVMRGQLLQHLLITHPLAESGDDGSIRNTRYSPSYLRAPRGGVNR
jgi:hypothetical protein